MNTTLLASLPSYERLAHELLQVPGFHVLPYSIRRFANQERQLILQRSVEHRNCLIVGSVMPSEKELFQLLVLCHTLKKERANKVSALVPYLAYTRQDKDEANKSRMLALIGQLSQAAGLDELITVDAHSSIFHTLLPFPSHSISTKLLFAQTIAHLGTKDISLVAPDKGALQRCKDIGHELGLSQVAFFEKTRHGSQVKHSQLFGSVGTRVLVIDDILDTGNTLISACTQLVKLGVEEIHIMVTHGIFTGSHWKKLWNLHVKKIYCTDTVPLKQKLCDQHNIIILPISPVLCNRMADWNNKEVPHGKADTRSNR